MTPSTPAQDLAAQWKSARRLYPLYYELAREFAIDVKPCSDLESGVETPGKDAVEQANRWLDELDQHLQVHQMRQFLQTSSQVSPDNLSALLQRFLAKTAKTDIMRDKVDFLLVQYFSQLAPVGVADTEVDLGYVAQSLEPILGEVDLKPPVWLNALDRVLDGARRCRSLDELLHGGILEQGRKAKGLAGDLFYLPVALVAFTRFGYLMRRIFFRLMLADLNTILEGLTELENKGVTAIDCRRAQFSAQEPIVRLRVICQSWKVMFQAEYSSGSPLRMLVDLRASVDQALGRGKPIEPVVKRGAEAKLADAANTAVRLPAARKPGVVAEKPMRAAAGASVTSKPTSKPAATPVSGGKSKAKPAVAKSEAPEFDISSTPGWEPDSES
jgi:hypothetical protein